MFNIILDVDFICCTVQGLKQMTKDDANLTQENLPQIIKKVIKVSFFVYTTLILLFSNPAEVEDDRALLILELFHTALTNLELFLVNVTVDENHCLQIPTLCR